MPHPPDAGSFSRVYAAARRWLPLFLILLLTAAAYAPTLTFEFVYDDWAQIVHAPQIRSWAFLPHYFTTHVWSDHFSVGSYYRPLFVIWLLLNYKLFGLSVWCWHLTTIAVHLAFTAMLYRLAARLTGDGAAAAFAALLFGLNPVHIEGVVWVSGVTEPLLALFFVGSLLLYLNSRQPGSAGPRARRQLAASLALYACALLEKETAVVLPALVFAYDWLYGTASSGPADGGRGRAARLRSALDAARPYVLLTLGYMVLRAAVLHKFFIGAKPLLVAWPYMLCFYLTRLVWPVNLSVFYNTPSFAEPRNFWVPLAILAMAAAVLVWLARRSRLMAFCCIFMVVPLLPVLNAVSESEDIVHDRYLYLPSIASSVMLGIGIRRLRTGRARLFGQPPAQLAAAGALAGLLMAGVIHESRCWENNFLLFQRAAQIAPKNLLAKYSEAIGFWAIGMQRRATAVMEDLVRQRPEFYRANAAAGQLCYDQGLLERADVYLSHAIRLRPRESGNPYVYLGLTRMRLGRLDEAEAVLRQGMSLIDPVDRDNTFIHSALGIVLKRKGDLRGALAEFRQENPSDLQARAVGKEIADLEASLRRAGGSAGNGNHHPPAGSGGNAR